MPYLTPITPIPPASAVRHALVVLGWNILVTAGLAAVFGILSGAGEIQWTREYGLALAAKVGADVVAAVVAYLGRALLPLGKYRQ
jgi:hypothetical protein